MREILFLSAFYLLLHNTASDASKGVSLYDYNDYNEEIYKTYVTMDKQLKKLADQSVKRLLPSLLQFGEHANISSVCSRNLFDLINGVRKLTKSSFNFLDSMGKLQSGFNTGNIHMYGEFEECVETMITKRGKIDYQGQYCIVLLKPLLPKLKKIPNIYDRLEGLINATRNSSDFMKEFVSKAHFFYEWSISLGICVPTGCSKEDISRVVKYFLGDYLNATVDFCFKKGDIFFWNTKRTIYFSIFILFGVLVAISTILDNTLESWKKKKIGMKSRILQCFSLTRNYPKMLDTAVPDKDITCIHGIRVLTMIWIIFLHQYFFHSYIKTSNHILNMTTILKDIFMQFAINGVITVDIFFFISGFVYSYSRILSRKAGMSEPGIFKTICNRLWRIYPAYIIAFFLTQLILHPHPPFHYRLQTEMMQNCDHHWWFNFAFINNLLSATKMCLPHSWFLAADMQLFLVTQFTFPLILRKPKMGLIFHIAIIIIVNLYSMSWYLLDDIFPLTFHYTSLDKKLSVKTMGIYMNPAIHLGAYFIGVLLGHRIATNRELKIPKVIQLFGWLIATFTFNSLLFISAKWNSGIPYTALESALYGAWSKTVSILAFSWLFLCCVTGHARLFNYILSLKLWIPLSRISYMVYLVAFLIQFYNVTHSAFPHDVSHMSTIWNFLGNLSVSILLSFALVVTIEWPILSIGKILFWERREKSESSTKIVEELTFNVNESEMQKDGNFTTVHL